MSELPSEQPFELDPVLAAAEFGCPVGFGEGKTMTLGEFAERDFAKLPMGRMMLKSIVDNYDELRSGGMSEEDAISQVSANVFGQPAEAAPTPTVDSLETTKKK